MTLTAFVSQLKRHLASCYSLAAPDAAKHACLSCLARLQGKRRAGSHSKGVMGLAWNAQYRNVLASASADATVKVWDVTSQQCQATLAHHTSKVQAVAWNPADPPVLLSGGFDRRICLVRGSLLKITILTVLFGVLP